MGSKGKCLHEPLWRLLGGCKKEVLAYAGNIDLNFTIEKLLNELQSLDDGFRSIKMRLGREYLSEDIKRLDAMRTHLPDDIMLMADVIEHGELIKLPIAFKEIEKFNLVWLEEPIKPDDFVSYAHLRSLGKIQLPRVKIFILFLNLINLLMLEVLIFLNLLNNLWRYYAFHESSKISEINNLPICSHGVHELHVHLLASCPMRLISNFMHGE